MRQTTRPTCWDAGKPGPWGTWGPKKPTEIIHDNNTHSVSVARLLSGFGVLSDNAIKGLISLLDDLTGFHRNINCNKVQIEWIVLDISHHQV